MIIQDQLKEAGYLLQQCMRFTAAMDNIKDPYSYKGNLFFLNAWILMMKKAAKLFGYRDFMEVMGAYYRDEMEYVLTEAEDDGGDGGMPDIYYCSCKEIINNILLNICACDNGCPYPKAWQDEEMESLFPILCDLAESSDEQPFLALLCTLDLDDACRMAGKAAAAQFADEPEKQVDFAGELQAFCRMILKESEVAGLPEDYFLVWYIRLIAYTCRMSATTIECFRFSLPTVPAVESYLSQNRCPKAFRDAAESLLKVVKGNAVCARFSGADDRAYFTEAPGLWSWCFIDELCYEYENASFAVLQIEGITAVLLLHMTGLWLMQEKDGSQDDKKGGALQAEGKRKGSRLLSETEWGNVCRMTQQQLRPEKKERQNEG